MPTPDSKSANESAIKEPTLIPRPNGRGALLSGGKPGNQGSPGRPKSEIRRRSQQGYDELLEDVLKAIRDPDCSVAVKLKALELFGRFGLGDLKEIELQSADVLVALKDELIHLAKENDGQTLTVELVLSIYDRVVLRLNDA